MSQQIFFQPTEVPLGARVRFCVPGSDEPADDVPPLTCLLSGSLKPTLYDLNGENPKIVNQCNNFVEGVRFVPAEVYDAEAAPEGTGLIVHFRDAWLNYEMYPRLRMLVVKLADDTFMSVHERAHDHWLRRLNPPEDARFVPVGECKHARTVDDAVLLFVEPRSKEWEMLEEAGCTFRKVLLGDFAHDTHPHHIWMPDGWHLEQTDRNFMGEDGKEYEVKDAEGITRAHAIFFPWQGKQAGGTSIREEACI